MYRVRVQMRDDLEDSDFCREAVNEMEGCRFDTIERTVEAVENWINDNRGPEQFAEGDTVYRTDPSSAGAVEWVLVSSEAVSLTAVIWIVGIVKVKGV